MVENSTDIRQELIAMLGKRSIVFIGMMGCGKTAIGRVTAAHLGLQFLDSDEQIEQRSNMSVADYFAQYGEAEFRVRERQVIANLLEKDPCLLALGGGAFLAQDTRETIAKKAISVWLDTDIDTLVSRVNRKPGKRPILKDKVPKTVLSELLVQREQFYAKADIKITTSRSSKIKTRDLVLHALHEHLTKETANV